MQHLSKEELQKLLIVARKHSDRDWLIILLSYNHALRVSEVTALTASNIRDGYLSFDRLKGSQSSVHPLFPSEREAVERLARTKPVGRLFPITRIQVGRLMKKYCRLAGIPEHKSHHHVLKHSTCMNMLDGGAQINEVQKFAGHKSLNSTAQYLKVSDERACRAFAGVAL
jgi:site-specific recombinase XerD